VDGPAPLGKASAMGFDDRAHAGQRLAELLTGFADQDPVVLGLPRGGVVVAAEVARRLDAPLDVIMVRKLGVPFQPELGMGAVGEDGVVVVAADLVTRCGISAADLAEIAARQRAEVERQARLFRTDRPRIPLTGRTAILVDDGIATGSTARAAGQVARAHGAARVVLAVPVAPPDVATELSADVDEVVCCCRPKWLGAIGQFYGDFSQVSDEEVVGLLGLLARRAASHSPPGRAGQRSGLRRP
jgi:putative phosphoribosyl transferase